MAQVLLLATLTTKAEEVAFLKERISSFDVSVRVVDISLKSGGAHLDGDAKTQAIKASAAAALEDVSEACKDDAEVVLGIGGGTGGDIILKVMQALPITFPKVLVTTLPFDPRIAVADNAITLVPTLADINGLNTVLRDTLENTAAMVAGLCLKARKGELTTVSPSVGITALGVTDAAVRPLLARLKELDEETTVFHANGYGGAAYSRFALNGVFHALIDLTPHEMTRLEVAGPHVKMPDRFSAGGDLPRITLPGGINFFTMTELCTAKTSILERPHYAHSTYFTHVKLTEDEMTHVAGKLAEALNQLTGPQAVIIPMGGFSSEDRPGGAIEDPQLRAIFRDVMSAQLGTHIAVIPLDAHINAPETTDAIISTYKALTHDRD